ncbi:MAG: hypothetical protein IT380_27440 [Myxococcales bacterium]|nr:hypothetical protein [Myxococcales bacterium]
MEQIERAFEPYRHLDPLGWVGVFRFLPVWGGLIAIVVGTLMLLYGGRNLFRLVAGPLGAVIATVWAGVVAQRFGFGASARTITLAASLGLLGLGLLYPPFVVFFAFGIPVGLLGGQLAGTADWLLGFLPGFMVGGALGVVMHRIVGAVLSAGVGAWVAMLGLMAALNPFLAPVGWLAGNPIAVLSIAGCFAIAGVVFQLFVRPSPEEAEKRRHEKFIAKKRAKEAADQEKRWKKYTAGHAKDAKD